MTKELLRCPFCGSEAKLFHSENDNKQQLCWVECTNDDCVCTADFDTEEKAIEKWNTRCYNKDSWTIDVPKEKEQELIDIIERNKNQMSDWTKVEIDNDDQLKKYIISKNDNEYLKSCEINNGYYGFHCDECVWTDNINDSHIFGGFSLDFMKTIINALYICHPNTDVCFKIIEVEESTTSWCNGNKSGSHKTVMPVSKGPGIIPTLSAEVEGLRKELEWNKNIVNRAYNLLFEANNHLDADDTKLRLEIEDWIKDSLDNPFSPDVISDKENE